MRQPLDTFNEVQSHQGGSTVGEIGNINHSLGTQMGMTGLRTEAALRANEWRNKGRLAMAEAGAPTSSGMGQIQSAMSGVGGIIQGIKGLSASAPGSTNFDSPAWTGAQQSFNDFYAGAGSLDGGFGGTWDGSTW